jgi:hypothetical protein
MSKLSNLNTKTINKVAFLGVFFLRSCFIHCLIPSKNGTSDSWQEMCYDFKRIYIYIFFFSLYFTAAHGWDIHELFIIFQVKYEGETDLYDLTREELMADYKDGSLTFT